jgi:patatin-like phospholipase/acyl hydrolase
MARYRILSFDGGGIRGLLTATLLERLEAARPDLMARADLFAGVSTGGIIALAMAAGLPPSTVVDLYESKASVVFADSILDDIRDLGRLTGAEYSNANLKRELEAHFGSMTLGDLSKKVVIASFDLDNEASGPGRVRSWKPKFFHNFPGPGTDAGERVLDVALRTSAAPTYFPVYQGYVDGGVATNNPSMCGLAQAIDAGTGGQQLEDIVMLSFGTGFNPRYLAGEESDWGLLQWARPIFDIILDGSVGVADYQCARLLGARYHRLNPALAAPVGLDDITQIPALRRLAEQTDLSETQNWLVTQYMQD